MTLRQKGASPLIVSLLISSMLLLGILTILKSRHMHTIAQGNLQTSYQDFYRLEHVLRKVEADILALHVDKIRANYSYQIEGRNILVAVEILGEKQRELFDYISFTEIKWTEHYIRIRVWNEGLSEFSLESIVQQVSPAILERFEMFQEHTNRSFKEHVPKSGRVAWYQHQY